MLSRTLLLPQPVPGDTGGESITATSATAGSSCMACLPRPRSPSTSSNRSGSWAPWSISRASRRSDGPVTVRLEPCGTATARLVDAAGKPIAGNRDPYLIPMLVTPGTSRRSPDKSDGRLEADQDYLSRIDPTNYGDTPVSDAQGRIVFPALIPGTTYRIDLNAANDEIDPRLLTEFTVKPGETLDLGDILIKHPRP